MLVGSHQDRNRIQLERGRRHWSLYLKIVLIKKIYKFKKNRNRLFPSLPNLTFSVITTV